MQVCLYPVFLECYNECIMRKSVFKIITIAAICFITAVCIFVGADIIKSRQLSIDRAQESLDYMCENYANEFRAVFDNGEFAVTDLAAVVEETIIVDEIFEDPVYYDIRIDELSKIARRITENSKYPISIYITFNPEVFREDIWFVKQLDGKVQDVSSEGAELDAWLEEWRNDAEFAGFYVNTVASGDMWFEPFYDSTMDWEVVSRTTAVYDEHGKEIGIVGADIYMDELSSKLKSIDELTGGISCVMNSKNHVIAGEEITDKDINSNTVKSVTNIGELWTVTIIQPVEIATQAVGKMIWLTIILAVILILALSCITYFVYQKHGKPIISEIEEKDVLMINQARQAQLGEMVGNIVHQLKQPLNGVNMALTNLLETHADSVEEQMDFYEQIEKMKSRIINMSETIDDFRSFLKPQKIEADFSVEESIEGVLSLMEEQIKLNAVKCEIKGDELIINGHENEFSQCIFNIVHNAIHAMQNLNIERCIVINIVNDGKTGHVSVENTGEPIAPENMDAIFDLYYTTKDEGTGIGLYITKQIIEQHFDGEIGCINTEVGVCFTISIPINKSEEYRC